MEKDRGSSARTISFKVRYNVEYTASIVQGDEWITEAEKQQIGWWVTSALESNIGLNAIAQWCATFGNPLPQGLGTGALFTDNVEVPLEIRKDCLWFCK